MKTLSKAEVEEGLLPGEDLCHLFDIGTLDILCGIAPPETLAQCEDHSSCIECATCYLIASSVGFRFV